MEFVVLMHGVYSVLSTLLVDTEIFDLGELGVK